MPGENEKKLDLDGLDFPELMANEKFKAMIDSYAAAIAEKQIKAIRDNKEAILTESKEKDAKILDLQSQLKKAGGKEKQETKDALSQEIFEAKMIEIKTTWEKEREAERAELTKKADEERQRADSMYKTTKLDQALTELRVNKEDRHLVTPYLLNNIEITRDEKGTIKEQIKGIEDAKSFGKDGKPIGIRGFVEVFREENPRYFSADPISGGGTGPGSSGSSSRVSAKDLESMTREQLAQHLGNGGKL